jgi:ubiquinone/menaquinone biosynthesis C-methylase UbiE
MNPLGERFDNIKAGRILDIATGGGGFIEVLIDAFEGHDEIIGIDNSEEHISAAKTHFEDDSIHFQIMDAHDLQFEDNSFDTASIRYSLHHFDDVQLVLNEMKRVLRPGGRLIICEMFSDNQTERQRNYADLHHWWAAIDRTNDISHNETFPRQKLIDLAETLRLSSLELFDHIDSRDDKEIEELDNILDKIIDDYIAKIANPEEHNELIARGSAIGMRIRQNGAALPTSLYIIGRK